LPTRPWLKPVLVLLVLGALAILSRELDLGQRLMLLRDWVETCPVCAVLAFVGLYVLACVAGVPGSILTLAAGAIFGLVWGTVWAYMSAVAGSVAAFLIARYAVRGLVAARLARDARLQALDRALGAQGLKIMVLLRLSPVFPFNFLNYGLGLTRVRLRDYAVASLAMLPGTFLYVYYGYAAGNVTQLAAGQGPEKDWAYYAFLGVGLAATLAVTVVITRIARKALKDAAGEPLAEGVPDASAETIGDATGTQDGDEHGTDPLGPGAAG